MKRTLVLVAFLMTAAQSFAACVLTVQKTDLDRGREWELKWNHVPGATRYTIESFREDPETGTVTIRKDEVAPRGGSTTVTTEVTVLTTTDMTVRYRISTVGVTDGCSATVDVPYESDSSTQRMMRKSVIPLVGSAPGANGSLFKTSLVLRGTATNQRGVLIFHPVNSPGHDTDPFIPYHLAGTASTLMWEDVVAAFGQTGLGSIDIVPEFNSTSGWTVPFAETRLYNVAPEGTYGTIESQTQAWDFHDLNPDAIRSLTVTAPPAGLRLNLAVRTFDEATVSVEVFRAGSVIAFREMTLARDFLLFNSAQQMTGIEVLPGDIVTIRLPDGGGVPMYTVTDNRSNDPALYMPPTRVIFDVGTFNVGF